MAEAQLLSGRLPDQRSLEKEFLAGLEGDIPRELPVAVLPLLLVDETLAPPGFWRETDWHIQEIKHLNHGRGWWLRWPLLAPLLRDQHETNRLSLIAAEKLASLLAGMEKRIGTYFSRSRGEKRASWVHRYRFLGKQWRTVNSALRNSRILWERGRHPRNRLKGRYAQDAFNHHQETVLTGLCEIHATLHTFLEEAVNAIGEGNRAMEEPGEEERMAAALWHAREGPALRSRFTGPRLVFFFSADVQGRLNRLHGIALEELSALLKNDLRRICILRSYQPDTVPMQFLQCD